MERRVQTIKRFQSIESNFLSASLRLSIRGTTLPLTGVLIDGFTTINNKIRFNLAGSVALPTVCH